MLILYKIFYQLKVFFKGYSLGIEKKADFFYNKKLVSNISLKKGFNLDVDAVIGNNIIDIVGIGINKTYNILLNEINLDMILELEYSRYLGSFTDNYNFSNNK